MALSNHDQGQLREYLLGKLSEDEQQKIEERLMVEDELFDEFEVSKDELVEEYRSGDLAQNDRQWFEDHFLATSEGRERHAFALAMDCLNSQLRDPLPSPVPAPPVDRPPLTLLERFKLFVTAQPWATATAAAVVLLVLIGVWGITGRRSGGQIFEATLTDVTVVRGEGAQPTKIKLPPNTGQLKLRLRLPKPATSGARYETTLDDRLNTKAVDVVGTDAESVTVIVPAELLPRGEYSLLLKIINPDSSEQQLSYRFDVE